MKRISMVRLFLLFVSLFMTSKSIFSQTIYQKYYEAESPVSIHKQDLSFASDTVCISSGRQFTVDSSGEVFFAVSEITEADGSKNGYRIYKTNSSSPDEELVLEVDSSVDPSVLVAGLNGVSLINNQFLLIFGSRNNVVVDIQNLSYTFISQPTINGQFVEVEGCFECMGAVYCNSLEGIGTQRIWKFDLETMTFFDPFQINLGLGFDVDYGCIGQSEEFARIIAMVEGEIRVHPWDLSTFILREKYLDNSNVCSAPSGFEVKNSILQILSRNDFGLFSDRIVVIEMPRCDSRNIQFQELGISLINQGGPIDSLSIHASQAPIDAYFRIDSQDLTISGNMTDSIVVYNTQNLSDEDFLSAFSEGALRLENIPVSDSITLELRVYDFLNVDGKTININLTGEPPCDDWSTSTSEFGSESQLYPNPFSDKLVLPDNWRGNHYSVYDLNGVRVDFGSIDKAYCDLSQLSEGTYFFKLKTGDNYIETFKVIKL